MTEKQLALLLRQIAGRLRSLAAEVEKLPQDELESRTTIDWSSPAAALAGNTVQDVRPAAVWRILDFATELEDEAELLKPTPTSDLDKRQVPPEYDKLIAR